MDSNKNAHSKGNIIVSIDPDFKDIVPGYLDHRHEDIKKILDALERNDFESIRIIGHTMKGGGYGFDAINGIGRSIEEAAIDSNPDEIRQSANKLSSYLDNLEIVYE